MATITFPTDTKDTIDAIREAIGRSIVFSTPVRTVCSGCSLDPITDTSTDSFCVICDGEGYVTTYSGTTISAHVTWGKADELGWVTGGQYLEGDCRVQIEYSTGNITVVDGSEFVTVDGKRLSVRKKILRGVPDLNRILIDLKEEDV